MFKEYVSSKQKGDFKKNAPQRSLKCSSGKEGPLLRIQYIKRMSYLCYFHKQILTNHSTVKESHWMRIT